MTLTPHRPARPAGQRGTARLAWVDAGRGLAIALVVLHHAIGAFDDLGFGSPVLVEASELVRTMRMPLFFALAGLVATSWVAPEASWRRLVDTKLVVLGWAYVLWMVLRAAWFGVVLPSPRQSPGPAELVERLWLPEAGWFLFTLGVFFLAARATARAPSWLVIGTTIALSVAAYAAWLRTDNPAWDGALRYACFFVIGVRARHHLVGLGERTTPRRAAAVVGLWAAAWIVLDLAGVRSVPGVHTGLRLGGVASGVCLAVVCARSELLRRLGRATLPVYLAHQLIVLPGAALVVGAVGLDLTGHPLAGLAVLVLPFGLFALALTASWALGEWAARSRFAWLFAPPPALLAATSGGRVPSGVR